MVENDLDCRFQELEEVVVRMTQLEKDTIPKLRVKEDIFKTVNIDAWEALQSCQSERSSKSSHRFHFRGLLGLMLVVEQPPTS